MVERRERKAAAFMKTFLAQRLPKGKGKKRRRRREAVGFSPIGVKLASEPDTERLFF